MSEPAAQTDIWDEKPKTDSTHLCACLSLSLILPDGWRSESNDFYSFQLELWRYQMRENALLNLYWEREEKKLYMLRIMRTFLYGWSSYWSPHTAKKSTRQYDFMTVYSQIEYFPKYIHFCRACQSDEMRPSFFFIWFIFRFIQYIPIFHAQRWQQYLFVSFFRSIFHMKPAVQTAARNQSLFNYIIFFVCLFSGGQNWEIIYGIFLNNVMVLSSIIWINDPTTNVLWFVVGEK